MNHVHYSENGENWIDFTNVPLKKWGDKYIYDWRSCIEWIEVPFKYEGLQDIMLLKYDSNNEYYDRYLKISYECCNITIYTFHLQSVKLGGLLNKVSVRYPDLIGYFKNGFQEAKRYLSRSTYKRSLQCVNCGFEKTMSVQDFTRQGFACPRCSTNTSFPERFTGSLLDEIGFEYETQKRFEGKNWRFDFYVPHLELIIEVHGVQHFKNAWTTKDEVVTNDDEKRKFIKFELGLNYAAIDISVSEPYYAWSMLEQNGHLKPYMQNVDCDVVVKRCNDLVSNENYNDIVRDYERGVRLSELSRRYKTNRNTLRKRLLRNGVYKNGKIKGTSRAVVCVTTGEQFESAACAARETNLHRSSVSANCLYKRKSAGKTPDGSKRVWMYLEDYEKQLNVN